MIVFGFFLFPLSEHLFNIHATKRLFKARTSDTEFFAPRREDGSVDKYLDEKNKPANIDPELEERAKKHRHIRLSVCDKALLLISNLLVCYCIDLRCLVCWSKRERMTKLIETGVDRIEDELDVVQLTKQLRDMRYFLKKSFIKKSTSYEIAHSGKNIIDLSASSSDDQQTTDDEAQNEDQQKDKTGSPGDEKKSCKKHKPTFANNWGSLAKMINAKNGNSGDAGGAPQSSARGLLSALSTKRSGDAGAIEMNGKGKSPFGIGTLKNKQSLNASVIDPEFDERSEKGAAEHRASAIAFPGTFMNSPRKNGLN